MKKIQVYDPPMCCSSAICGPNVDPTLVRFNADFHWLANQGVAIERYNLATGGAALKQNQTGEILILDRIEGASFPMYRFLQRLYFVPGMVMIASARGAASLGALSRLFWDPRRILQLRPLHHLESQQLFAFAARHFGLLKCAGWPLIRCISVASTLNLRRCALMRSCASSNQP